MPERTLDHIHQRNISVIVQGGDFVSVWPFEAVNEAVTDYFLKIQEFCQILQVFCIIFC